MFKQLALAIVWLTILLAGSSLAQSGVSCSDSALIVADQLKQLGRVQWIGQVRSTKGTTPCALPGLPSGFATVNTERAIAAGQIGSVDTAFRGRVVVRSAATLSLKPGVYKLSKLSLEWDAKIVVDTAGAKSTSSLEIQVADGLTLMDRVQILWPGVTDSAAASRVLLVVHNGGVQLGYDARFLGTLLAPRSTAILQDRVNLRGRLLALNQTWGWDAKGIYGRLSSQPSWLKTHIVAIQGERRFWTNKRSVGVTWTVDGIVQDTGSQQAFTSEGRRVIVRCFENFCDSVVAMVDWTAPVVRILSPADGFATRLPSLSLVWSADGLVNTDAVSLQEGLNSFTRYASDSAGNRDSAGIQVTLDLIPPKVKIVAPISGYETNKPRIQVVWTVDGVAQPTDSADLQEGWNRIRRFAADAVGNQAGDSLNVFLDTKPPVINFLEPASGTSTGTDKILVRWKVDTATFEEWADLSIGDNRIEKTAVDGVGNRASASIQIFRVGEVVLPEPVAPAYPSTRISDLSMGSDFLIKGETAVQTGFQTDSTKPLDRAVLRGVVVDQERKPLVNVQVTILNHSKYGVTRTRAAGNWDLLIGGGNDRVVVFEKAGYHTSQRTMDVHGGEVLPLDTVVLVRMDTAVTQVQANAAAPQVVAGSVVRDQDGLRQSVVILPSGTGVEVENEDGTRTTLSSAHLRITEYTVGELGPKAMPADLPPTVGYTFCADVTVDEAPKANHLQFSRPVPFYVDNFLKLPVGWPVPVGSYDRKLGDWKELPNGRIIQILGKDGAGLARIDMNGDGLEDTEDSLNVLGLSHEERTVLGGKYADGTSLMRALTKSFSPIDLNFPIIEDNSPDDPEGDEKDSAKCKLGCEIDANNQLMRERIRIPGSDMELVYNSEDVEGRKTGRMVRFNLWTGGDPSNLVEVRYSVNVAGRLISGVKTATELFSGANYETALFWDGLDAWGRRVYGSQKAIARVDYVRTARYGTSTRGFNSAGRLMNASTGTMPESRIEAVRTRARQLSLIGFAKESQVASGWSLSGFENAQSNQLISRSTSRVGISSEGYSSLIKVVGGGASFADSGVGRELAFSTILDLATDGDDVVYFLTSPSVLGGIDSSRIGIWETSRSGEMVKKIFPAAATTLDPCSQSVPKKLAIGPHGGVLFYAIDRTNSYGSRSFVCLLDPKSRATSFIGFVAGDVGYLKGMTYVETRGVVLSYGNNDLEVLRMDGVLSAIRNPDHKSIYALAASNNGRLCTSTFENGIEEVGVDDSAVQVAGAPQNANYVQLHWGRLRGAASVDVGIRHGVSFCQQKNGDFWYSNYGSLVRVSGGWADLVAGQGSLSVYDGAPRDSVSFPYCEGVAALRDGVVFVTASQENGVVGSSQIYRISNLSMDHDSWFKSQDGVNFVKFDSLWRHVKTSSPDGRILKAFEYDASGLLVSVLDSLGRRTDFQRNASGEITSIVAPDRRVTKMTYGANGMVEEIILPDGKEWRFSIQSNGLMQQSTDPQGLVSTYTWDSLGRLISDRSSDGAELRISSTRSFRKNSVAVTNRSGSVETYVSERLASGEKVSYAIDDLGQKVMTDLRPDGDGSDTTSDGIITNRRLIGGDPSRKETEIRYPDGSSEESRHEITFHYVDPSDWKTIQYRTEIWENDQGTKVTRHDYARKLIWTKYPDGRMDTSWLNALGQVERVFAAGKGYRSLEYDANGNTVLEKAEINGMESVLWKREYSRTSDLLKEWVARVPGQPLQLVRSNIYDALGRLTASVDGRGERTEFGYDSRGNQVLVRDSRGRETLKEFDTRGRVVAQWDPEEMAKPQADRKAERWLYDYDGNAVSHTDKFGISEKNIYTKSGLLLKRFVGTDTTRFEYDSLGRKILEIDPKDRATLYTYDVRGRQTQVIQKAVGRLPAAEPGDQVEQTQYDNQGRPTQLVRNGVVQWENRYDWQGRMIGHWTSSWNQQTFFYDSLGRQDIVVANGHTFENVFDEWGRIIARLRDGDTLEVVKLGLDGSVLERRRPGSGAESLVYDAMGAVVRQSDSTGQSLTRILGAGGIDSLHLDALGNSKANIADFLGRTISTRDERGNVQRFGYDDHGELAWLEDNEGNRTRFETQRWESGEVRKSVKTIYPDGKTESVSYGSEGELLFRVDGNGIKTVHKYDRWGQLSEVTYQDAQGVPLADTTRFRYDNFGRRTHAHRGADVDSTAYDPDGRVVGELQVVGGATYRITHTYPEGNRLRVTVLPDGSVVRRSVAEGFGVDSLWFGNNLVAGIRYQQGRESSRTLGNGIQANRVYDVGGRLSGLAYSKNGSTLAGFGFGFDPVGNLSSIRRTHETKGDEEMKYTADHQLGDWSRGTLNARDSMTALVATQGWVLDSRGNWTGWSNGGIQESRLHSPANEMLERRVGVIGALQAWDNAGNLVSDGQRTYQWNHKGQLQSITAGMSPIGQYTYDPLGRRTVKTAGGLITISVYDGWQCIWQKVTGSGTDTTKAWVYGNYIDEPIAMVRSWGTSSDTLWYLQGNNYNVEALTDRTGAIVERYAYTPYGEPTVYTAPGTDGKWFTSDDVTASVSAKGNALTFQGRELDAETGVYYFRNRYYSAQMGRFVSRDPKRNSDLNSLFRFVSGQPSQSVDPLGLEQLVANELLLKCGDDGDLIGCAIAKWRIPKYVVYGISDCLHGLKIWV